jgi:hypothetical protein
VKECINKGGFSGVNVETMAISLWANLHGLASLLIKERLRFIPQDKLSHVIEQALIFSLRQGRDPSLESDEE